MIKLFAVHLGFMVDKPSLEQAFLRGLRLFSVTIIPPMLHKVKVKFSLEQAMKAQRVSRGIALLFL